VPPSGDLQRLFMDKTEAERTVEILEQTLQPAEPQSCALDGISQAPRA
jgi:hypothetical protein